jgi:prolyl-tRNA editing enzyme YbaK/EbsC (Cys-tRNA(Pro) deacylase)
MPTPLEQALAYGNVDAEIIRPGAPTPTVATAAAALGVDKSQILKSLLFLAPDGSAVLAVATGPSRVDRVRLAAAAGVERLKLAPPEEVERRTGYPVGGAAPVCHATPLRVIVDRRLLDLDIVYGGGGTDDSMLKITPGEIVRVTGATVAAIIEE